MPRNDYVSNDYKSLPRVFLFEPGGSSAEVSSFISITFYKDVIIFVNYGVFVAIFKDRLLVCNEKLRSNGQRVTWREYLI